MLKSRKRLTRSLRRRHQNRWASEQLEDRALLSAGSSNDLIVDANMYSDNTVIVQFDEGYVNQNALPLQGIKVGDSLGTNGLYEVYLDQGVTPEEAIFALEAHPAVSYAHPDFTVSLAAIPNDPDFNSLWGMNNTGQTGGTADADIDAVEAWDIRTDASEIVVAVIDTGIDYTHPDLAANMWVNDGEIPGNGVDDDNNGFIDDVHGYDFVNDDGDPMDDNDHGTHVAGTIGAVGNNNVGVVGVAWDVQLMAVKFLGANGSGTLANAIKAINYASQMNADIANNSWGGGGFVQSMQDAINSFTSNGGIFTAAAGNHGGNNDNSPFYPANYENVVSVAASTQNDTKANFSGFGVNTVDIAAPGVSIRSTIAGGGYANFSGTSMATPMVSGVLAVLQAEFPTETDAEILDRMYMNADPILTDVTTYGRVNLFNAITAGSNDQDGPKVDSSAWSGATEGEVDTVTVTFNESIDPLTFTPSDVALAGPGGSIVVDSVTSSNAENTVFEVSFAARSDVGDYTMDIGPNLADLAGNLMDQDMDGTGGEAGDDVFTTGFSIENEQVVFEWNGNQRIRDARRSRRRTRRGVTVVRMRVSEDIAIDDLDVQLTVNHTWTSDLAIYVFGPGGRSLLFNRRGGAGDNILATFDDEAATAIADGTAPFDGAFRPESSLSAFDGSSTLGRWYLVIYDLAPRDVGRITNIKLIVTPERGASGQVGDTSDSVRLSYQPTRELESLFTEDVAAPVRIESLQAVTVAPSFEAEDNSWRDDSESVEIGAPVDTESDLVFALTEEPLALLDE